MSDKRLSCDAANMHFSLYKEIFIKKPQLGQKRGEGNDNIGHATPRIVADFVWSGHSKVQFDTVVSQSSLGDQLSWVEADSGILAWVSGPLARGPT